MIIHQACLYRIKANKYRNVKISGANLASTQAYGRFDHDSLYDYGVTELYSLIVVTAAKRLDLAPHMVHLDSTSLHVDGRYNRDEEPGEGVIHITRGSIAAIIAPTSIRLSWS